MHVDIAVRRDRIGGAPASTTVRPLDYHTGPSGLRAGPVNRVRVRRINCQRVDINLGQAVVESAPASATISALENLRISKSIDNLRIGGSNDQPAEVSRADQKTPARTAVGALGKTIVAGCVDRRRSL